MKTLSLSFPLLGFVFPILSWVYFHPTVCAQENTGAWSIPRAGGENIIEPSPEVAAMRRFVDYPVSYASGTVDVSIPLLSLPDGFANISLGITCQTGGIRRQDQQSAVGLGWTLTGLGSVSRHIKGFPDEWRGGNFQSVKFDVRDYPYDLDYIRSIIRCETETEYDRYSYNLPGYSGSFMIVDDRIVQLPQTEVKITRIPDRGNPMATLSFTLTTPDGLMYEMTEQEHTSYSYIQHPTAAFQYDRSYDNVVTAWHVTRISHPESLDNVVISYTSMSPWARTNTIALTTYSYSIKNGDMMYDPKSETTGIDGSTNRTVFYDQRMPSEIRSRVGRISFDTTEKHDDISAQRPPGYIRGMILYDNSGNAVRKVSFDNGNSFKDGRRRLDGLTITQDGVVTDRYDFTYIDNTDADGYDVFGYPNGQQMEYMSSYSVLDYDLELSERRKPNYIYSSNNSLKTITDINGLTTSITYGRSTVQSGDSGLFRGTVDIGIRVAKVTTRDIMTGRHRTRSFIYEDPVSNINVQELNYTDFISQSGTHYANNMAQTYNYILGIPYLASSRLGGYPVEQARIYYRKVTETVSGTDLSNPVHTIYRYDLDHIWCPLITSEWHGFHGNGVLGLFSDDGKNLGNLNNQFIGQNEKDHNLLKLNTTRGYFAEVVGAVPLLKSKTMYEWKDNGYRERYSEEYTYTTVENLQYRAGIHCESVVFRFFERNTSDLVSDNLTDMNDVYSYVSYLTTRDDIPSTVTRTIFYNDGNSRSEKISYRYCNNLDPTGRLPGFGTDTLKTVTSRCRRPVVTETCSGEESVVRYSARSEHAVPSAVLYHANMYNMRHLPVADRWIFRTEQGQDTVLRRYRYGRYDIGGGVMITKLCAVTVESGMEIISGQHYHDYDMFGNITSMTDREGRRISARWEPGNCLLSEMTLQDAGLTTRYTHRPLVGCTSVTFPSGQVRRFGYTAGRLTDEHNTAEDLVASYTYRFYGDSVPQTGDGRANRITATVHDTSGQATDVTYYDGFGLPVQTVSHAASGGLVRSAITYDALDRPVRRYLPVPADDDGFANDFQVTAAGYYGDGRPFSQLTYRPMADDRPLQVLREGEAMREHPGRYEYLCNNGADGMLRCRRYRLSNSRDSETVTLDGYYPAGALDVTRVTDPDGCTLLTFTDWRGLVILERRIVDDNTFADTYRLYDVPGNVRVILQPEASAMMTRDGTTWTGSDEVLDRLAFINRYDRRGNCIYAKVPGGGAVRMRYDPLNRLAFRQTAVMRERGEAEFTLYDPIGRVAVCGITPDGLPQTVPVMTTRYDGSDIAGSIDGSGYTVPAGLDISDAAVTLVNYYDSYDCLRLDGFSSLPTAGLSPDAQKVKGNLAATRTAVFSDFDDNPGPEAYLHTLVDYDIEGNVTGTVESTIQPGTTLATKFTLSRQGKPLEVRYELHMPDSVYVMNHIRHLDTSGFISMEKAMPGYESAPGRVHQEPDGDTATEEREDLPAAPWQFTVDYSYDGLGRLESKTAGAGNRMSYSYNLRGQLKSVTSPVFTQTLCYEDGGTPCHNGNISAMKVGYGSGNPVNRSFTYDRLNRLSSMTSDDGFNTAYSYNLNSGPLTIMRQGVLSDGTCGTVDDLTVSYDGNRPVRVTDHADPVILEGSLDFAAGEARYSYDSDGRMTSDTGRGIEISYNPIDRPAVITTDTGTQYRYTYDATGRKLGSRRIADTPVTAGEDEAMLYIGPFELKSTGGATALHRISLPWGYITGNGDRMTYVTDYQGNIRAVVDSLGNAVQTTGYYPYGLPVTTSTGPAANPYKYSGKELETRDGLNRYDFHARQYDPALGLFDRPDPMAINYPGLNPYLYCAANPIRFIDKTGKYFVDANGVKVTYDAKSQTWSENATQNIKRFAGYLNKTPTGQGILSDIFNSDIKTSVMFETRYEEDKNKGNISFGLTEVIPEDENKLNSPLIAIISIFEETINENAIYYQGSTDEYRVIPKDDAKVGLRMQLSITVDEFIEAVCAHEGRHAIDKENLTQNPLDINFREQRADETEIDVLRDIYLRKLGEYEKDKF